MNIQVVKKIFYVLSVVLAIITNSLSSLNFVVKIVFTILQIIINVYLVNLWLDRINSEIKKIKLKGLEYLGIPPKIELFLQSSMLLVTYVCVVCSFSGHDRMKIEISSMQGIAFVIMVISIFVYGFMGQYVAVDKIGNKTKYIISNTDSRAQTRTFNILGRRIGKYDGGIVIDSYIFKNEEILNAYYHKEKQLIIYLTDERQIIIEDKKSKEFLMKTLKESKKVL